MRFLETEVEGAFVVEADPHADMRGTFVRTFCARTFAAQGLETVFLQCSLSTNKSRGTLRGMHYQVGAQGEAKLVRVVSGRIFDVAIDLRPGSRTFMKWSGFELCAGKPRSFYIPPGCAHGYLTLEENSEVFYQISAEYDPSLARGVRWNDPVFAIDWPFSPIILSERDAGYPDFSVSATSV